MLPVWALTAYTPPKAMQKYGSMQQSVQTARRLSRTRRRIRLHHDFLNFLHSRLSTSDERHHHVDLALADGPVPVKIKSLELELSGDLRRGRVQHSLFEDSQGLWFPSLPSLGIQVAVLKVPAV